MGLQGLRRASVASLSIGPAQASRVRRAGRGHGGKTVADEVCRTNTVSSENSWGHDQLVLRELQTKKSTKTLRALDLQQRQVSKSSTIFRMLKRLVGDGHWDMFWGIVVVMSSTSMILEEEYKGIVLGHRLGVYEYYGSEQYLQTWWPQAPTIIYYVDCAFTGLFVVEILLTYTYDVWNARLGISDNVRAPFWTNLWDFMDFTIVTSSIVILALGVSGPLANARFLRIFRLVRMLRLVRLMRQVENLDTLHLMTTAIRGSLGALSYSMMLLSLILTLFAMLLSQALRFFYLNEDSNLDDPVQQQLFEYFGTYTRSMVSMFELTLANWIPLTRFLMEECHEIFGFFCVCFKLSVGFACIGVINGVFIQETFGVATNDEFIMVRSRMRQTQHKTEYLRRLFVLSDQNNDSMLSKDEFHYVMEKRAIRIWLEALGISCTDPDEIFDLIARDRAEVSIGEFIAGMGRLAGVARNLDMVAVHDFIRRQEQDQQRQQPRRPNCSAGISEAA